MTYHFGNQSGALRLTLGVALLLSASCGSATDPAGAPCTSAADCPEPGMICAGSLCTSCQAAVQCEADFGPGATCVDGLCAPAECLSGTLGCPCQEGDKCSEGQCMAGECVDCQRGALACVCFDNATCDPGGRCNGLGVCEECPYGSTNCPCGSEGLCDDGLLCQSDVCAPDPCPAGTDGCPCLADKLCEGDLRCFGNGQCAPCTNDIVDCPCVEGQCTNNLVCDAESDACRAAVTCQELGCVLHQSCEEKAGQDATCLQSCDEGFVWSNEGTCDPVILPNCTPGKPGSLAAECEAKHRECVASESTAQCGDCLGGYIDEAGSLADCRPVATCESLDCAIQNRICIDETPMADGACGNCLSGFREDPLETGTCVPLPPPNCQPDELSSILVQCNTANRLCIELVDNAQCGDCLEGYAPNEFGECIPSATCEELGCAVKNLTCLGSAPFEFCGGCIDGMLPSATQANVCAPPRTCQETTCPADMFCIQKNPQDHAECFADPCQDQNEAWSDMDGGKCVACGVDCNDADLGETGRIWPYTLAGSKVCICETEPGYFWDDAPRAGVPCDADADGWVRSSARSSIASSDISLRENARCRLNTIDRFALRNEYQQELEILLCMEAPTLRRLDQGACLDKRILPLYESVRNDKQAEMDSALETDVPAYSQGGQGRRLLASEVNGLTKACTEKGDYNHNDISDISEWHGMPQNELTVEEYILANFSYYVELDTGWWQANLAPGTGRYVIQERNRCANDFPLTYLDGDGPYWRQCTRSRDVAYNPADGPNGPEFGLDFARWSCDAASGGCPIPPPPTDSLPLPGPPPAHGLCEVSLPLEDSECGWADAPWPCVNGSVWRGMSHHSQFRCVKVAEESSTVDPVLPPSVFAGEYRFNKCRIPCPMDDPTCVGECVGGSCLNTSRSPMTYPNPFAPVIVCEAQLSPQPPAVGWALAAYQANQASYVRGCINEWQPDQVTGDPNGSDDPVVIPWRSLCPGWAEDPMASIGEADALNFGALECGCGSHYGGPQCDQGCPDSHLHLSPGYDATPRTGYWMCGRVTDRLFGEAVGGQPWKPTVESTATQVSGDTQTVWTLRSDPTDRPTDGKRLCQDPDDCTCPAEGPCDIGYVLR